MKLRYDRGTIVLEAQAFPAELNTSAPWEWDARLECWRTLSRQYINEIKRFAKQQIEIQDDVALPEWHHPAQWTLKNTRTYQSLALSLWNLNDRRGIVCLPTGAGKSHLALSAMAASQCATLCLVPTRILLHQWKQTLSESYSGKIGMLGDGHHTLAPLTVATYESAYRNAAQIGQLFKLLVVDEAHHFGKGVRDEILDTCVAPYRLGLTATLPENEIEKQNLGARIGKVVYQLDLKDLTGTYLADYKHFLLRVALTLEERKLYELHRTVCENFQDRTRKDFDAHMEQSAAAQGFPKFKLALALKALDLEWKKESTLEMEASVLRNRMFSQAAELIRQGVPDWDQKMGTRQGADSNLEPLHVGKLLYSDLRSRHTLSIQSIPTLEDLFKRVNSEMILHLLRNSARIELKIRGHARALVRQAKLFGLICNVTLVQEGTAQEECLLEISGPLAILRKTTLYCKALCSLLPVIAWCPNFHLIIVTMNGSQEKKYLVRNGDPLLPGKEPRCFAWGKAMEMRRMRGLSRPQHQRCKEHSEQLFSKARTGHCALPIFVAKAERIQGILYLKT